MGTVRIDGSLLAIIKWIVFFIPITSVSGLSLAHNTLKAGIVTSSMPASGCYVVDSMMKQSMSPVDWLSGICLSTPFHLLDILRLNFNLKLTSICRWPCCSLSVNIVVPIPSILSPSHHCSVFLSIPNNSEIVLKRFSHECGL